MFSIVVLQSNDRCVQFKNTIELWNDCDLFSECEKIVCVDGNAQFVPEGFRVIEIPRLNFYCWGKALNTGIEAASNDLVFYFDSDRIVPKDYFLKTVDLLSRQDVFVFCEKLFSIKTDGDVDFLRGIRDNIADNYHYLIEDFRVIDPFLLHKKNPFSGGVGFHKKTFLEAGGFDPRFVGWGYPDYDFFMNIYQRDRRKFHVLDMVELHQKHKYEVSTREFELHNLWNCNQYLHKWSLPKYEVEDMRCRLGISQQILYGSKSLSDFLRKCESGFIRKEFL